MENNERISGALQENLLTLLCFDNENCKIVRAALTPQHFESAVFREVAGIAIDFIDQYGETVGEHLPDHLEDILKGKDTRKASTYERLVKNLFAARDGINSEYIISQLHKFVRQQNLKDSVIKAVEALEDGRIDDAEVVLQKGLSTQSVAFEGGLSLNSPEDVLAVLDQPEEPGFELGIPEFDSRGLYPRRKELTMFVAARGMGKSWFITHCAKRANLAGMSALIITLEMGEKPYAARTLQSFLSLTRRQGEVMVTRFSKDKRGNLSDLIREKLERMSLKDDDIKTKLLKRIKQTFTRRAGIRIKAFPSGTLTTAQLEAYLDGLERFDKFIPDVILIDYPDLMELDTKNLRIELGNALVKIRGIAVKRNAAAIAVSQGNRESERATTVSTDMVAEDISKLATADLMFTYSQTPAEHILGLARILAGKARNEGAKFSVLITQAYALGQFCLDSVLMKDDYWDILDENDEDDDHRRRRRRYDDDEDDDPPVRNRRTARKTTRRKADE